MIKKNLIANYLGQVWVGLMGLAFIPIYIKYLGIESFALIGLFALLQSWLGLLDMGMASSLSREMSRFTAGSNSNTTIRDLLRSIEIIFIVLACFMVIGIWLISDWLAVDWLRAEKLSVEDVANAFILMGAVSAMRFIEGIYRASIVGLQQQVLINVINSAMATIRGLGAVAILAWVSSTVMAFFVWQAIISILTIIILAKATYKSLPKIDRAARFSLPILKAIKNYAGGVFGITILELLLTQVDKIILSKLLTLSEYGYYTLAVVVAGSLNMLGSPILGAWFPRLNELYAQSESLRLSKTFHQGAQLMTVLMGSGAVIMIFFAEIILRLWSQDDELSSRTATLIGLLAAGNLLRGLMALPYQTQLAHGWTSLAVQINIVSVLVIVPTILWVTPRFGAVGAAWVWIVLNAGYLLIGAQFMYRRILVTEKWRWYCQDVFWPLVSSTATAWLIYELMPVGMSRFGELGFLLFSSGCVFLASAMTAPLIRVQLVKHFSGLIQLVGR